VSDSITHVVTLVHGTFARNANWTLPESELHRALINRFHGHIKINTFSWSGANRNRARMAAGEELFCRLSENNLAHPSAYHFIIAHSHGGNIALYATKTQSAQDALSGIICMNTPFVSVTRRDAEQLFFLLGVLVAVALAAQFVISAPFIGAYSIAANILIGCLAFGFYRYVVVRRVRRVQDNLRARRDEIISNESLPKLNKPRVLCLSSASDEVLGIFQIFEGITSIPFAISNLLFVGPLFGILIMLPFLGVDKVILKSPVHLAVPYDAVSASANSALKSKKDNFGRTFITTSSVAVLTLQINSFGVRTSYIDQTGTAQIENLRKTEERYGNIPILMKRHILDPANTTINIMLLAIGSALIASLLFCLGPMGVTWRDLFSGFFVRRSFTRTPLSAPSEFRDFSLRLNFLNHSAAYNEPDVIGAIISWIDDLSS
jgi:hypothetical protein